MRITESTKESIVQRSSASHIAPLKKHNHFINKRPEVAQLKSLYQIANQSAQPVIQRVWDDSATPNQMDWNSPIDGLHWHFNIQSRLMHFTYNNIDDVPEHYREQVLAHQNDHLTHGAWLELGWGLFPTGLQGQFDASFKSLAAKGMQRYQRILDKNKHGGAKALHPATQASRDAFFKDYYKTHPTGTRYHPDGRVSSVGRDSTNLQSDYKHRPPGVEPSGNGRYVNQFPLGRGQITADQNYALAGGEKYYDQRTGNITGISNSEVLYQQWKIARTTFEHPLPNLHVLRRAHIAGPDGRATVKSVREHYRMKASDKRVFHRGEEGFFALLAAPNSIAALWLILDHGDEMNIHDIGSITLLGGNSIEINFAGHRE